MWVFCKSGFFSAVAHDSLPDTIHVRSRFKGDLDRLCKNHGISKEIHYTPEADYPFRMNFKRDVWKMIMEEECDGIDYPNFKNSMRDGTDRDAAYLGVWTVLRRYEYR